MNNKEKLSERKAYFEKRTLELAERNKKVRRKSSADWLESVISNSNYGLSDSETLTDIFQRITEQTGIPQGYFSSYNEYIDINKTIKHKYGLIHIIVIKHSNSLIIFLIFITIFIYFLIYKHLKK